jgi:hypothetical protein
MLAPVGPYHFVHDTSEIFRMLATSAVVSASMLVPFPSNNIQPAAQKLKAPMQPHKHQGF